MSELQPYVLTAEHLARFDKFTCGDNDEWSVDLNDFLRENAIAEGADRFNTTYVFYDSREVPAAYVTLSASQIAKEEGGRIPLLKSGARYPFIPAVLIGRFAVDVRQQARGYGTAILAWIEKTAAELPVGCRFLALHVDNRNGGAIQFYAKFGFIAPEHLKPRRHLQLMLYDLIDVKAELAGGALGETDRPS